MEKDNMRILITGGAGFIGSNFIRHLLGRYPDCRLVNLDKLTYCGHIDNLRDVEKSMRYTFVKGYIAYRRIVEKLIRTCAVVVIFAAEPHVDRSILDSGEFI